MIKRGKFMVTITACLFVLCSVTVTVGAQVLDTLGKEQGIPISSVAKEPRQAALQVIDKYFEELKKPEKDLGTPVESYRIVDVDITNPDNIKIQAAVVYKSSPEEMPITNFYVVKEKSNYVVKSEKVIYDMIPSSPTYGTIISGAKINELQ